MRSFPRAALALEALAFLWLSASCGQKCPLEAVEGGCSGVADVTAVDAARPDGTGFADEGCESVLPPPDVVAEVGTGDSSVDSEMPVPAVCGDGTCQPALGEQCGSCPQDCSCPAGMTCADEGGCCLPGSCGDLGMECGLVTDGCGQEMSCGACKDGKSCIGGVCTDGVCKPVLERVLSGEVLTVALDGTLGMAGTAREVLILRRSEAGALSLASRIPVQWGVREVLVEGATGYVLTRSTPPPVKPPVLAQYELLVLHLAVPEAPEIVGSVAWTAAEGEAETTDLAVEEGTAWLILGGKGPYSLDVSKPDALAAPVYALAPGAKPPAVTDRTGLALFDGKLYVHGLSDGVTAYDVSSPGIPKKTGAWSTTGAQGGIAATAQVVVVGGAGELLVIDPDSPGSAAVPFSGCGDGLWRDLKGKGAGVYGILQTGSALKIAAADFSNPESPTCWGGNPLPDGQEVAMAEGRGLVAAGDSGILAFGFDSTDGFKTQGGLALPEAGLRTGSVTGSLGCLGTHAGLGLWNLSRPEAPEGLSFLPVPGGVCGAVALGSRILALRCSWYHSSAGSALLLIDRSDPTRLKIVDELALPGIGTELTSMGGDGYLLLQSGPGQAPDLLRVDVGPDGALTTEAVLSLSLPSVRLMAAGDRLVSGFLLEKVSEQDVGGIDVLAVGQEGPAEVLGQLSLAVNPAGPLFAAHGSRGFVGQKEMAQFPDSTPSVLVNVSGPGDPVQVGAAVVHGTAAAITSGRVWVPGSWGRMEVVDATQSGDLPVLAWKIAQPEQTASYAPSQISVVGGYAFLFGDELAVVDVHGCWGGK
jgi:hypothetical protein